MNGYQRIMAALRGEWPDKVPVMLHNFILAAREAGIPMSRFRKDGKAVASSFIRSVEAYGYDGILVDIDTTMLAGAVGVPVDYPDDQPARCSGPMLRALEEVENLKPVDLSSHFSIEAALEAVHLLKRHFGPEIAVRGNCDQNPFSLAGSIRGLENWMLDLIEGDSGLVRDLLEYCLKVTTGFLRLMSQAGADILSNGDSPAGPDMISPAMYRTFALPYERVVCRAAHELGRPYILHICGNTDLILSDMGGIGVDGLELDYKTDARLAREMLSGKAAFVGNLDPSGVLALGSSDLVYQKTREILEIFGDTPRFILNAGCAVPAETPPENIRTMIAAAREFQRKGD